MTRYQISLFVVIIFEIYIYIVKGVGRSSRRHRIRANVALSATGNMGEKYASVYVMK